MRTRIKFCGLVRPEDVDAGVQIGADAIGFVFYQNSPRALDAAAARALRRRLPSFVVAVGLFVNAPEAHVRAVSEQVGLDVIQFHGDESPHEIAAVMLPALALPRPRCWKAHRLAEGTDLAAAMAVHPQAEFHLLDSRSDGYGGSGQPFDWALADGVDRSRLIVAGGIGPDNVAAAIARLNPFGVDSSSGIEGETARQKDVGRMEALVEAVRAADANLMQAGRA